MSAVRVNAGKDGYDQDQHYGIDYYRDYERPPVIKIHLEMQADGF
jgi:hypothetical protein